MIANIGLISIIFITPPQAQWRRNDIELGLKKLKTGARETFREAINKLIISTNESNELLLADNAFTHKVIIDLNVLSPSMEDRIGSEMNSRNIITP